MGGIPSVNHLLAAIRQHALTNPFAPPQRGQLTPMPNLPAGFATPPTPPQPQQQAPMPPPPAPNPTPLQAATGLVQQNAAALQANPLYTPPESPTFTPPPYTPNPKGDAISAGIQMLGAAFAPQLAPGIDQNLAAQQKIKDESYQRNLATSRQQYEDTLAKQAGAEKTASERENTLENRLQLSLQAQQIASVEEDRKAKERAVEQYHGGILAHYAHRDASYEERVREQTTNDVRQYGLKQDHSAFEWHKDALDNQYKLWVAGIKSDTARDSSMRLYQGKMQVEKMHEMAANSRAANNNNLRRAIASQTQQNNLLESLIRAGVAGNAPEATQARLDSLFAPGPNGGPSQWDMQQTQNKLLGIPTAPPESLMQMRSELAQADLGAQGELPYTPGSEVGYPQPPPVPQYGGGQNITINVPGAGGQQPNPWGMTQPGAGGALPAIPQEWSTAMTTQEQAYRLPPGILRAIMGQESGGRPSVMSGAGAMGLLQLMPDTAKEMGVTNPYDPIQNIGGGAKYLAQMLHRYGNLPAALAAYNAGPTAYDAAKGDLSRLTVETQQYVPMVLQRYQQVLAAPQPTAQATTIKKPDAVTAGDSAVIQSTVGYYDQHLKGEPFDTAWPKIHAMIQQAGATPQEAQMAENALRSHAASSKASPATAPTKPPVAQQLPPQQSAQALPKAPILAARQFIESEMGKIGGLPSEEVVGYHLQQYPYLLPPELAQRIAHVALSGAHQPKPAPQAPKPVDPLASRLGGTSEAQQAVAAARARVGGMTGGGAGW